MKIIIFDTETTGLAPGNICQLSYVIIDNSDVNSKNFYFTVDYVEPRAQQIHGLSTKKLFELSNNKRFSEYCEVIKKDFESVDIFIGHNYDFDIRFLVEEFRKCGQSLDNKKSFCTMKHFTPICKLYNKNYNYKYPKLEELCKYLHIGQEEILKSVSQLFGQENIGFHDSRYDVAATYLCYLKGIEQGLINESDYKLKVIKTQKKSKPRRKIYSGYPEDFEPMEFPSSYGLSSKIENRRIKQPENNPGCFTIIGVGIVLYTLWSILMSIVSK